MHDYELSLSFVCGFVCMVIARNLKELLLLWTTNAPFSIPLSKPWHLSPCFARMLLSAYIVVVVEAIKIDP